MKIVLLFVKPILVQTYRGEILENQSQVFGLAIDGDFREIERHVEPEHMICPRSTLKPFQAMPYVLSGAFEKEGGRLERLALACASHQGEDMHIEVLKTWITEIGLGESDLVCGPHPPDHAETARALIRSAQAPTRLHNNCSGKHIALLAGLKHTGEALQGYADSKGRSQKRLYDIFNDFLGEQMALAPHGLDGCGLPVPACSLEALARAWLRLLIPPAAKYEKACALILKAMAEHPLLVEGTASFTSEVIIRSRGDVVIKVGADGVYAGICRSRKMAFVFKCADGQYVPVEEAVLDFLKRHQLMPAKELDEIFEFVLGKPRNWAGQITGRREVHYSQPLPALG